MTYKYSCEKCKTEVTITKPMSESSREEFCEKCGNKLTRVFTSFGLNTFGDGYKT